MCDPTNAMKSFAFPGNIEPEILSIAAGQVPYMRASWFSQLVLECEIALLNLVECEGGRVIPYTASGTAAMDACVNAFVSTRRRALVVNGGAFGARWRDLCRYYQIPHDEFAVPFGQHPDMDRLGELLATSRYDVLLMQHHETSSGYLYDLESIARICETAGVRLVVDAISSFLTDGFSMRDNGIDVAVISSQKGLNLPPGLSFVVLSKRILDEGGFASRSYYFDWNVHLSDLGRGQTPFSPATHLFMQLHARLIQMETLGVEQMIAQVSAKALAFRNACLDNGWSFAARRMSNCLSGVILPFPARPLVSHLSSRQIYVMPSGPENMIRVGHIGTLDAREQIELAKEIKLWETNEKP